jgi:hypothetical protein
MLVPIDYGRHRMKAFQHEEATEQKPSGAVRTIANKLLFNHVIAGF